MTAALLEAIAALKARGPFRSEIGRKQLTLAFGGLYIVSTTSSDKPLLVWETEKSYPRYYIPENSLHSEIKSALAISTVGKSTNGSSNGHAYSGPAVSVKKIDSISGESNGSTFALVERLTIGPKSTTWVRFTEGQFKSFIRFERSEIDDWFENGILFAGIKNPYKRIDTAAVSHHIAVKVAGEVVAESNVAVLLNETGLKEAYYIPATSIKNWGAVEKSDLRTACPYKGEAWYLSLTVKDVKYDNLIWYYQYPTHESAALQGLISFYNKEGVDILVDGIKI